jgi:hypothetical protein
MHAQDWRIYVAKLPEQRILYSSAATLVPVVVNAHTLSSTQRTALKSEGCELDDYVGGISRLNPFFCELTAIHWMLDALDSSALHYIGNAHYRRHWAEGDWSLGRDELVVSEPFCFPQGVESQFLSSHRNFPAAAITVSLAERGLLPFSPLEMRELWRQPYLYGLLMARGPSAYYKQFMQLLFECLWPIWNEHKDEIVGMDSYNRRMIAFIAERMMTGLVLQRDKFFSFPIATSPVFLAQ